MNQQRPFLPGANHLTRRALLMAAFGASLAAACGARSLMQEPGSDAGASGSPGTGGSGPNEPCGAVTCGPNAHCDIVQGRETCVCDPGFTGDGFNCSADCADIDLSGSVPNSVGGNTRGGSDFYTARSCGATAGSPDFVATFEAPERGTYHFDTYGSEFDTVLAVLDGVCQGAETCNDDTADLQSEVVLTLAAGQTVTAIVDGYAGSTGPFVLNVWQAGTTPASLCPDAVLEPIVPINRSGSTRGQSSFHATSCGAAEQSPDDTYVFTAPTTGDYIFDTDGSSYDTVLALLDGFCTERELACNDDWLNTNSHLEVFLQPGQTVTVVVTGFAGQTGNYQLNVSQAGTPVPACPDAVLGDALPLTESGSTLGQTSFHATSCGAAEQSPDATFVFTAPSAGEYIFATDGSSYDTVLALLDGFCGDLELACNDDWRDLNSRLEVFLEAGQTVTVVVSGFANETGEFLLNVSRAVLRDCPNGQLVGTLPLTESGSTSGQTNSYPTSCGAAEQSPDITYVFTAAATGQHVFDTNGSSYDTVLALLAGYCTQRELACNDDTDELNSQVEAYLQAGETVTVVVTGYAGQTGEFLLNVTGPGAVDCPDSRLPGALPLSVSGSTDLEGSYHATSCGWAEFSPDYTYIFTAPYSGSFVFNTNGSSYDTVLALLDGFCTEEELACNDDWSGLNSQVEVYLEAAQVVTVVVTGYDGQSGEYLLNVTDG